MLTDFKTMHERSGNSEITPEIARDALLLLRTRTKGNEVSAKVRGDGIAIAVGGDNHAPITIAHTKPSRAPKSKYPQNSIGADANMCNYIDYLFALGVDYWKGVDAMNPGRLGRKIKERFRLKLKTRNHLSVD